MKNALIFRFVAKRSIRLKDLENTLNSIWKPSNPTIISMVGEGIYIASFENISDYNKVLAKQPWHLNNSQLVMKKALGNKKIEEVRLNEVPFWIQIHGLEIQLRTRYVSELIGNKVGRVLEIDSPIPTYTMTCFRIPLSLCKDMETICARFWWEDPNNKRGYTENHGIAYVLQRKKED